MPIQLENCKVFFKQTDHGWTERRGVISFELIDA